MTQSANRSRSHRPASHLKRRGAVTPLIAFLLVPFAGMVAFALDVAWIVQSRSDLQSAADSAALAGAEQLMSGYVQYSLPIQTAQSTIISTSETTAKTYAKNFASYNTAGGVSSLTLNDGDIEFGFTDASNNYTAAPGYTGYPNTVKVTMRLDSSANGALKLFFAPVLGITSTNVRVTAAATIYTSTVTSLQSSPTVNSPILPMTLDVNAWDTYTSTGKSSDGTVHSSANGAPQMEVYPSPSTGSGNFGMLSLDNSSNSSSAISSWVTNGLSSSDISALKSSNLIPVSMSNSSWNWSGVSGFKAGDLNDLTVGSTYVLLLFEPVVGTPGSQYEAATGTTYQATDKSAGAATPGSGGVGSNAYYNIIKVVGVQITQLDKSSDAYVQPAAVINPTFLYDSSTTTPAGTAASFTTTFAPPKLTQ
jgi:Flp pilus assembly protein TadG